MRARIAGVLAVGASIAILGGQTTPSDIHPESLSGNGSGT
jgi:hypothetical protein